MDQLRLILLVVGVAIIVLIYVWGMRARIKAKLKERRRRAAARLPENEPVLDERGHLPSTENLDRPLGDLGQVSSENDPFAHQRLVDVEIRHIKRPSPETINEANEAVSSTPADKAAAPDTGDKTAVGAADKTRKGRSEAEPAKESSKGPEKIILLTVMAPAGQSFRGRNIAKVAEELDLKLSEDRVFECLADSDTEKGKPIFGVANILEPGSFDAVETLSTPGLLVYMRLPAPVESVTAAELMLTTARQLAQRLGGTVCDERRNKLTTQTIMHFKSEITEFERRRRIWAHQQPG